MNTYGLFSINSSTFNLKYHTDYRYPEAARNTLVTFFKIHNLVFNVLGYIPGVSTFSGCGRMGSGLIICAVTLIVGDRNAFKGLIIGHWYDEALLTGVAQIAKGAFEAFVPYGKIVNASLDAIATVFNLTGQVVATSVCTGCMGYANHGPYRDPDYPFPFSLLHLV